MTTQVIPFENLEPRRTTTTTTSSSSTSTTTTTVVTEPGVFRQLEIAYRDNIGGQVTPMVMRYLTGMIRQGMEPGAILEAIEQTGWAPRPSAVYLRAIINRWWADGITTREAAINDSMEWERNHNNY